MGTSRRTRSRLTAPLGAAALLVAFAFTLLALPAAALASPTALQIDTYLAAKGSPLVGAGADFVAAGQASGVDPAFLVAITGAESSFGKLIYHAGPDYASFNAWNWFYAQPRAASDFASWSEGIQRVAQGLSGSLYYGAGRYGVLDIAPVYCPDGTQAWIDNVTFFMGELGGNPADTRLTAESATMPPAATPTPSAGAPSGTAPAAGTGEMTRSAVPLLELVGSVAASPNVRSGADVEITFTVKNVGLQAGQWEWIGMVLRRPTGTTLPSGPASALTLASGQELTFTVSQTVDKAGQWDGAVFVRNAGAWYTLGPNPAFSFVVTR
jgi:hypothetical protein